MARPPKIKPIKLKQLLDDGLSSKEIAKHFNCSLAAISQAKKKLGSAVIAARGERSVFRKDAPLIIDNTEAVKRIISSLVEKCQGELDWMAGEVKRENTPKYQNWQDQKVKQIAEIRKLIKTLADIEYKLIQVETVERALTIMLEEVGHESPELQRRIKERLRKIQILFFGDD